MKRLITFTVVLTIICCISCKPETKDDEPKPNDSIVETPIKKYVIGSYYNEKGVIGIVYYVSEDSTKGMLVSLDETICAWAKDETAALTKTEATNVDDGVKNVAKIKEKGIVADHPAFNWCDKKTGGNWYLPAQNELWDLALICSQLQDSLDAYKGTKFDVYGEYWSSTEKDVLGGLGVFESYVLKFNDKKDPTVTATIKTQNRRVRAIRAF
jgi:hypothetical protein